MLWPSIPRRAGPGQASLPGRKLGLVIGKSRWTGPLGPPTNPSFPINFVGPTFCGKGKGWRALLRGKRVRKLWRRRHDSQQWRPHLDVLRACGGSCRKASKKIWGVSLLSSYCKFFLFFSTQIAVRKRFVGSFLNGLYSFGCPWQDEFDRWYFILFSIGNEWFCLFRLDA